MASVPDAVVNSLATTFNDRDLEGWARLFSPAATISIPGLSGLKGAAQVQGFLDFFTGLGARWRVIAAETSGTAVGAAIDHDDAFTAAAGIGAIHLRPVLIDLDESGRIRSLSAELSGESSEALGQAAEVFVPWAMRHLPGLFEESGALILTRKNGARLGRAAQDLFGS